MRSEMRVTELTGNVMPTVAQRIKVHIHCRQCGEMFVLRGIRNEKGRIETGFKKCLCGNDRDFDIETLA